MGFHHRFFIINFMGYELEGKQWKCDEFEKYVESVKHTMGWANSVTIHHMAYPDLEMRPNGLTPQHMRNLRDYYENELGWSAGPHLFIDDHNISGMSGLQRRGVHAVAFNATSIGIEMLGSYDVGDDDPFNGRGSLVLHRTAKAVGILLKAIGLEANENTIHFHRDDPNTSKTCPGTAIKKDWFVSLVKSLDDGGSSEGGGDSNPEEPFMPMYDGIYKKHNGEWYAELAKYSKQVFDIDPVLSDKMFYIDERVITDTFYDSEAETTFGSVKELLNV